MDVDGYSSLEVQAFVNNIFDQYANSNQSLSYLNACSVADTIKDTKMPMRL